MRSTTSLGALALAAEVPQTASRDKPLRINRLREFG
jgi:hypothetical protein